MTTNIQELSEKLANMYEVDAHAEYIIGEYHFPKVWLAEDSGRVSDLCDENGIDTTFLLNHVTARSDVFNSCSELYGNHPTKSAAARMARVRCLLAIGEQK